jgi:hypothetical protein
MKVALAAPFILLGLAFTALGVFIAGETMDVDELLVEDVYRAGIEGVGAVDSGNPHTV